MKIFVTGQHERLIPGSLNYGFPSRLFYSALEAQGIAWTSNLSAEFMISINHNSFQYNKFAQSGHGPERCILIRTEPDSVFPAQYSYRVKKKYGLVLSPGNIQEKPITHQFYEFQEVHGGPTFPIMNTRQLVAQSIRNGNFNSEKWAKRPITTAMIASNKFSPLKINGYKLRREVAKIIQDESLIIYGKYWNESLFRNSERYAKMIFFNLRYATLPYLDFADLKANYATNVRGETEFKSTILPNIKFLLVIENSMNVFTEKLFDAMLMGAIPLYVGPDLNVLGIPSNTYIKLGQNAKDIYKFISKLDAIDVTNYLSTIKQFITSDYFYSTWCDLAPYEQITNRIIKYIDNIKEQS